MKNFNTFKNKELNLIIEILNYQINPGSELNALITETVSSGSIDWDEFLRLVEFHKVYTLVYDTVKEFESFPAEIIEKLKQLNHKNIRKSLAIAAELKNLNMLLGENNISFTVFKGQPLSQMLYRNLHQRSSKDIDILINKEDLGKILKIFKADYKPLISINLQLKYLIKYYNHIGFVNKNSGVIIEVHWKLIENEYLAPGFNYCCI